MYGIGDMLYLPHSPYIFEVDISKKYTVYVSGKNIMGDSQNYFENSEDLSIFDSKLYSIISKERNKLSFWDHKISKWITTVDNPYKGTTVMTSMTSDMKQGIIVPKPEYGPEFVCPISSQNIAKGRRKSNNFRRRKR